MTTVMRRRIPGMTGKAGSMARQLAGVGTLAGLLGGLAMIVVMILVMGAAGMGYATPPNVGMVSFVFTIVPSVSMLSPSARATVMSAMPVMRVPLMRTAAGVVATGVIGGALVYVVMRWGLLPSVNPLMAFVPQTAFFLTDLLFGLVAGVVLAVTFRRCGMTGASARAGQA